MTETPVFYGSMPQSDFESQYKRILEITECKTQSELAAFLEVRQSSISDAKRRKAIPPDWLLKLFTKRRINPDWIRTGIGGKTLQPVDETKSPFPVVTVIERRPMADCTTDELLAELVRRGLKIIG